MNTNTIDKSTWGPGPWHDEPDRVEWRHLGFPCLAVRHARWGNWCGYVGVPPVHPLYQQGYSSLDLEIHGGLTYAGLCHDRICHEPQPGEPEHVWWLGFDCGHAGDFSPGVAAMWGYVDAEDVYRDMAYVTEETNQLAAQLATVRP